MDLEERFWWYGKVFRVMVLNGRTGRSERRRQKEGTQSRVRSGTVANAGKEPGDNNLGCGRKPTR